MMAGLDTVMRRLAAASARTGERGTAARIEALSVAVAAAVPDATIIRESDLLRFAAPGLRARAFGSRRRGPDPRLAQLAGDGR